MSQEDDPLTRLEDGSPTMMSLENLSDAEFMQINEPEQAMPRNYIPPSTPRRVSIPDDAFQLMCWKLNRSIQSDDTDHNIRQGLALIWVSVQEALSKDQRLRLRIANEDEFKGKAGDPQFIDLLKDIAKRQSWRELLENGAPFLASHSSAIIAIPL
jgi:hypothetical protein